MAVWLVAGTATTIFICIYDTEDFKKRLNMKQPPDIYYKLTLIGSMFINLLFCYIWEVKSNHSSKFKTILSLVAFIIVLMFEILGWRNITTTMLYFFNRFLFWTNYYLEGYYLITRSTFVAPPYHSNTLRRNLKVKLVGHLLVIARIMKSK